METPRTSGEMPHRLPYMSIIRSSLPAPDGLPDADTRRAPHSGSEIRRTPIIDASIDQGSKQSNSNLQPLTEPQLETLKRVMSSIPAPPFAEDSLAATNGDLAPAEELPPKSDERPDVDAPPPNATNSDGTDAHGRHSTNGLQVAEVPYDPFAFGDDPDLSGFEYNSDVEIDIYRGKYLTLTERPWIELGRGNYLPGPIPPSETWLGKTNLISQHFLLYGDYRTALAYNKNNGFDNVRWASRLNLELDWKLTATERVHAFIGPTDRGLDFTHVEYNQGKLNFNNEFDENFDTIFFEGDIGAIYGGLAGIDTPFDLPFAVGLVPVLYQNGIWIEDAILGGVITIPAKYVEPLNWTNYDLSLFAGFNEIDSPAFGRDDSAAKVVGTHASIDAFEGYLEAGFAYLNDDRISARSYRNLGISFSRRYFHRVSNAVRLIINSGQDPAFGPRTAEGQLLIFENALVSCDPNYLVPYFNFFAGFGTPQSVARAGVSGGILRNVGINFETDGLTGYPLLDDTANNTFGGAIGLNMLADRFAEQLIVEFAWVTTHDSGTTRRAVSDQYGFGVRYQRPLNHAWIVRCDAMHGIFKNAEDVTGIRTELRYKF